MKEMQARLAEDKELAAAYQAAHEDYIQRRDAIEVLQGFPSGMRRHAGPGEVPARAGRPLPGHAAPG